MKIVFLLSIGRSGSTWLAKSLSEELGLTNIGENRYFWDKLFSKERSKESYLMEIQKFLKRKGLKEFRALDKSTNLYKYLPQILELGIELDVVFLRRNVDAISDSKEKFAKNIFKFKRIRMRLQKYWKDYGWRFFIPILQRWRFILIPFGYKIENAFNTLQKSDGAICVSNEAEYEEFAKVLDMYPECVILDYDDLEKSIKDMSIIGLSESSIERILLERRV